MYVYILANCIYIQVIAPYDKPPVYIHICTCTH